MKNLNKLRNKLRTLLGLNTRKQVATANPDASKPRKPRVAICALCKNEKPYILEWLAYHKMIGIKDFVIYDNVSDDGTSELLISLDALGEVKRIHWPRVEGVNPQVNAFNHFEQTFGDHYDYVLMIDLDEFLVLNGISLSGLIAKAEKRYPQLSAIVFAWKIFGSGGQDVADDRLVMERFQNCANWRKTMLGKSLIRLDRAVGLMHHRPYFTTSGLVLDQTLKPARWAVTGRATKGNGKEQALKEQAIKMPPRLAREYGRVYHYYTKSREEWIRRKAIGEVLGSKIWYKDISDFERHVNLPDHDKTMLVRVPVVVEQIDAIKSKLAALNVEHARDRVRIVQNDKRGLVVALPQAPAFRGGKARAKVRFADGNEMQARVLSALDGGCYVMIPGSQLTGTAVNLVVPGMAFSFVLQDRPAMSDKDAVDWIASALPGMTELLASRIFEGALNKTLREADIPFERFRHDLHPRLAVAMQILKASMSDHVVARQLYVKQIAAEGSKGLKPQSFKSFLSRLANNAEPPAVKRFMRNFSGPLIEAIITAAPAHLPSEAMPPRTSAFDLVQEMAKTHDIVYVGASGNLGDALISGATFTRFDQLGIKSIGTFGQAALELRTERRACYVIKGGGNLVPMYGTLATWLPKLAQRTDAEFIILPHTISGLESFFAGLGPNFHIFCREAVSYSYLKSVATGCAVYADDDCAVQVKAADLIAMRDKIRSRASPEAIAVENKVRDRMRRHLDANDGLALLLRVDVESAMTRAQRDRFGGRNMLDLSGLYGSDWADEVLSVVSSAALLESVAQAREIWTDRLHCAISGALTGVRTHMLANGYYKNRAVYDFSIRDRFPNVTFEDELPLKLDEDGPAGNRTGAGKDNAVA